MERYILVILIILLFGLLRYIFSKKGEQSEAADDDRIKEEDIVLTKITTYDTLLKSTEGTDYGLLWNCKPNVKYEYSIKRDISVEEPLKGKMISKGPICKLKGLPLEERASYTIEIKGLSKVTTIKTQFEPAEFLTDSLVIDDKTIRCNTSTLPTDIEVVLSGQKIPLSMIDLIVEPPGFVCKVSGEDKSDMIFMIYNGRNTSSILKL